MLQIRAGDRGQGDGRAARGGPRRALRTSSASSTRATRSASRATTAAVFTDKRDHLQRTWGEVTLPHAGAARQPATARARNTTASSSRTTRGFRVALTFEPTGHVRRHRRAGPRVAILREQGVNGQVEMAAAFDRAGFEAVDVHMTDLIAGRVDARRASRASSPAAASPTATCSAAGRAGPRPSCSTRSARGEFERFFARSDTFALGACNGCQMFGALKRARSRRRATGRCSCATARSSSRRASSWSR